MMLAGSMSQATRIDSRFATAKETADVLGVPQFRAQQFIKFLDSEKAAKPTVRRGLKAFRKARFRSCGPRREGSQVGSKTSKKAYASRKRRTDAKASKASR